MEELTRTQARARLAEWQRAAEQVKFDRDYVIRQALVAGLEKKEIFQLTGIARSTINRIESNAKPDPDAMAALEQLAEKLRAG